MLNIMSERKRQRKMPKQEDGTVVKANPDGSETFTFFHGRNVVFSNFYPSKFVIDKNEFNCTEQYFHYKKAVHFKDEKAAADLLKSENPGEQKSLGRQVKGYDEIEWNRVGTDYMKECLLAKFQQNDDLRKILLDTAGTTLVEASPRDRKWGIGLGIHNPNNNDRKNWRGKNLLGKLLTEVREQILLNQDDACA